MLLAFFLGSVSLHLGVLGKTALEKNRGRLLNPIQVVNFPQDACVVNVGGLDTTGVCLSGSECNARAGIIIGSCAQGFGACCTILVDDCTSSNFQKNLTYIVNPSYPSTYSSSSATCKYTLSKGSSDICMIRLDFVDGTISEPADNGDCETSYFTSNPVTGPAIPPICGGNDGLHLYMDAGAYYDDQSTFSIVVGESGLDWKILVSQIECDSSSLPWPGCLQYYMGAEGQVYSFNYFKPNDHLQDQHYNVCIRQEDDMCSIGWIKSPEDTESFKLSINAPSPKVYYGRAGMLCYADFALIPRGSNGGRNLCDCGISPSPSTANTMPTCDTFCGGSLNCNNNALGPANSEIISSQLPFILGVNLNSAEPSNSENRGFNMIYRQYPCNTPYL